MDGQADNVPSRPWATGLPSMPSCRRTAVRTAVPSAGRRKDGRMIPDFLVVIVAQGGVVTVLLQGGTPGL
jgi:hypothetical protein